LGKKKGTSKFVERRRAGASNLKKEKPPPRHQAAKGNVARECGQQEGAQEKGGRTSQTLCGRREEAI